MTGGATPGAAQRMLRRSMRFDERFLDEIKSRLRPSDVIGRTVKLRRQGREYVGLSPFTKEKTIFKGKPASKKIRATSLKALKDLIQ